MKLYLSLLLCLLSFSVLASKKAITDEGELVVLNEDGTWHYDKSETAEKSSIPVNSQTFSKGKSATFQLKSTKTSSKFWIDPKKWQFKKANNGHGSAEYTFKYKKGDLYGMAITEQLEIQLEELVKIAFDNAKNAAPDARVTKKEYRMVNGHKVIYMEIEGTIQSIKFTYLGYYYSDSTGSTQYLTYTGSNLVKQYQKDIDAFLNGFTY